MESRLSGEILCEELASSRSIRSFVEKRIRRWLHEHAPVGERSWFRVLIRREGPGHRVYCHVDVDCANAKWTGSQYDNGLHQALDHCLRHLAPRNGSPLDAAGWAPL